jgi:hypothetical protein
METAEEPQQRQIVCSACFEVVAESFIHVIPYFNTDAGRFVTTYRCEECWLASLEETRARLERTEDETEIATAAAFFESHGVFVHEHRRGDPIPVIRKLLMQMIDLLRSGAVRLSIGPLAPANEAQDFTVEQDSTVEIEKHEKRAEAAYDAMYEARPHNVKDCFDDAHGYLTEAIAIAKRAGLDDEVTRLTARRDHIVNVYISQFRGIGR